VTNKPLNIEKVFKKLKKENEFELVYNKGSAIISGDKKIKANYFLKSDTENKNIKIGLSISSNKGNSVWRNKIKRLIREAIRLNRETLLSTLEQKNANLFIIFSPHSINQTNNKKIFLKDIKASVLDIITRLKNKLVPAN
jgi:ribonuclease P protein component